MTKLFLSLVMLCVVASACPIVAAPVDAAVRQVSASEVKMKTRYPQPVKVGDLIGLPVLDAEDRTLGYVENVVRSSEGRIRLIVPYASWLGWPRHVGPLDRYRRPIAVPIETVVILGRQIDALEMDRPAFDRAPAWIGQSEVSIPKEETISIGIGRR